MENSFVQHQNDDGSFVSDLLTTHTPEQLEEEKQLRQDAKLAFRPGYITIPIEAWYTDERLNDGDILLLSFILGYLKNNEKLWMSTKKLMFVARKNDEKAVIKQITKFHNLGYIKKTNRSLLGGGKQRIITLPDEVVKRPPPGGDKTTSPGGKITPSIYNISNLSNTNLVNTVKRQEQGAGARNRIPSYQNVPESKALNPTPSGVAPLPFENFWRLYPRRVAKANAEKAWRKLSIDDKVVAMKILPKHKAQVDWLKEGGKFIPHAASWINARRWEDEIDVEEVLKLTPEQVRAKEERNQRLFSQTREQRAEAIKNLNKQNE